MKMNIKMNASITRKETRGDVQSKNVESSAYAFDSARIQIPLGLRQPRAHSIQGAFDSHIVSQNTPKF